MDNTAAKRIKDYLERLYDIPFEVNQSRHFPDWWFDVKPQNSEKELFSVSVKFKNQLRMVIEVTPEKYSAFSIADMAAAPIQKKKMFAEYSRQLNARRAKTEFYINDTQYDVLTPETWPVEWKNYHLRVTRSPICAEDEAPDEGEIASSWIAIIVGMFLSLLTVTEKEEKTYLEGGVSRIEINRYERNPVNRELCLVANGYTCKICGFNFEEKYGEVGRHFIHVHHIVPVSKSDKEYMIDPVKDLLPVCPNCHAMLHRQDPPLMPEELKILIESKNVESFSQEEGK